MANINATIIARAVCVALAMAGSVAVHAQAPSDSNLDVTIRLLPENAVGPEDITRRITLPPSAANPAPPRADAADGALPDSNNGRGEEVSSEARERGREFGQEVSERARENRENAGRPDDAGPPDDTGRPDNPSPPVEPPASPPQSPPGGPPVTPPGRP